MKARTQTIPFDTLLAEVFIESLLRETWEPEQQRLPGPAQTRPQIIPWEQRGVYAFHDRITAQVQEFMQPRQYEHFTTPAPELQKPQRYTLDVTRFSVVEGEGGLPYVIDIAKWQQIQQEGRVTTARPCGYCTPDRGYDRPPLTSGRARMVDGMQPAIDWDETKRFWAAMNETQYVR